MNKYLQILLNFSEDCSDEEIKQELLSVNNDDELIQFINIITVLKNNDDLIKFIIDLYK